MATKQQMTMREYFFSDRMFKALESKNYDFLKANVKKLHKPTFNVKASQQLVKSLTYRKINDWDSKNLLSVERENNPAGWRRFSFCDLILLNIITDLRVFGFSTENIKKITSKLSKGIKLVPSNPKTHFMALEYYIYNCLSGYKTLLAIDDTDFYFFTEDDLVSIFFGFDNSDFPFLTLPFYTYVEKIAKGMKMEIKLKKDSVFSNTTLDEKEKKILDVIRNRKYREVTLIRSDDERVTIKAKSDKSGNFTIDDIIKLIEDKDYQNVTVTNRSGKKVSLSQEELFRL